ncbi:WD40 repeat [Macleaya cordata]|uniref:WD40 repeat n=1 Tax=Macleaya cordata TaxID=56857 RepID=A0A200RAR6_MACCD|nr:WD40 repeat [Macleaya cordata]
MQTDLFSLINHCSCDSNFSCSIVVIMEMLPAWNTQTNSELSLDGFSGKFYALAVGNEMLLAGTQMWELETLQCIQTLTEHTSVVMSILCWDLFLLSCSLNHTIKVWVATESGKLEVTYTHQEEKCAL